MGKLEEKMLEYETLLQRISYLTEQQSLISDEILMLQTSKNDCEKEINTITLLNSLGEVRKDTATFVSIWGIGRTTAFFDNFVNASTKFLVLAGFVTWQGYCFDLVIAKINNRTTTEIRDGNPKLTVSYLKGIGNLYVPKYFDITKHQATRERFLLDEIQKVATEIQPSNVTTPIAFNNPCAFHAQLPKHRSGNFGREYYGDELVYQGYNFGDTLRFAIIGLSPYGYFKSM